MEVTSFKIGRQEFVVIPRKRYEVLSRAEQDQRDAGIARKARQAFRSGKLKTLGHDEVKRKLGI